jgi:hypothetical protein
VKPPKWKGYRAPPADRNQTMSHSSGYFRFKSTTEYNSSPLRGTVIDSGNDLYRKSVESQPNEIVRVRKRHKVRERIHLPNNLGGTGSGPIVSKRNIKISDVSGRITAAFEKIFRSKSQESRRILEYLQLDLLGHVITTSTYLRDTAKFLCVRQETMRIYKKPSFKAVRCLLSMLKDSKSTSYQIGSCVRKFSLCVP